jgi:diguanylate cyclase (GGDEF)-like protein/putative nucleotidyltransferase with HDIG domain
MDADFIIPLIATIAYVPLFVILLTNRPWQPRHKLFVWFLIPTTLWSLSIILFHSNVPDTHKLHLVRIGICLLVWMLVQLHYFIRSFYQSERTEIPLAYLFPIATSVLAATQGSLFVSLAPDGAVDYGPLIIPPFALFLATVGFKDIRSLAQKYKVSPNPAERNQIIYLIAAIGILTLSIFSYLPQLIAEAPQFPWGHIGNFLVAFVFTYAVVKHRLADIRVVFRQAIVNVVLYGGGLAIAYALVAVALLQQLGNNAVTRELLGILAVIIFLGIPAILFLVHTVRDLWQKKVEEAFIGARYSYRRQLSQFITMIHDVTSLGELGSEFTSLIAQSFDCKRACLLLPEAENEGFSTRFIYPPVIDNPLGALNLKPDSPIVTWLERENTILPERNLAIFPEFQSMWTEEREEIRSAEIRMFVPLMNRGKLISILAISERRDGKLYTVEDIDLLEFISGRVAASMAKEYSHEQLREQDEETTLVNRLTAIITSNMSIQMIFDNFTQELKKVVDVDWAAIALIDGNELYFVALSSNIGSVWQKEERIPLEGTATERSCQDKQAVYEDDLKRHHRFWTWESYLQQGIRSVVDLPLNVTDRIIGSLILASRQPKAYSSQRQRKRLEKVALQIAAPVENAHLYNRLEQRSRIDELTGLFNRRHFEERLKEEVSRHSRYGDVFSIFMLDLDNFKAYNDTYGHPAGDTLLSQMGRIVKGSVRNVDQAFRYGGDEFVIILPQTTREDAYIVAERVRVQIARTMEKQAIAVTSSIGLANYPADGVVADELIDVADNALYHAKRAGGNRILVSSDALSELPDEGAVHGTYAKRNGLSAVYALVSAVEAKEPYIYDHSRKVNTYAVALAESIGLSPDQIANVSTAALLHDIGKIGIPDKVLNKKGKLNEEDWRAVKTHPELGATIIKNIPHLAPCVNIVLYHHERWDGGGYPEGLQGEQIPMEARILAIADSFEAMTSARPYRPALPLKEIIKQLKQGAGLQFDPNLVDAFIRIVEAGLPGKVKIAEDSATDQTSQ